jgi:hypothetical protein
MESSSTEDARCSRVPEAQPTPLSEDLALAQLKQSDLLDLEIEKLADDTAPLKSRKVRFAIAIHPRTPRRLSLRLVRELYTFDLMRFSLMPTVTADLKRIASELLIARLDSITLGERISLARRCSAKVAAALLLDKEPGVWQAALENDRLAESAVAHAVQRPSATPGVVEAICHHSKWSVRPEVRLALLRSRHTPLASALQFARSLPPARLRDVLHASRLPEKTKAYLLKNLDTRAK